jgi:oxalate decarboxylase/phosphoglucose isomerase-like protein (cupin superfamily)
MMSEVETIKFSDQFSEWGEIHIHVWEDGEEWYSCRSGTNRGIYAESDDLGPFITRQKAIDEQLLAIG